MEEVLFSSEENAAFVEWVMQFPELTGRVAVWLSMLEGCADGPRSLVDWLMRRDAANGLHMIAREGGFEQMATGFAHYYDLCCRNILACAGG